METVRPDVRKQEGKFGRSCRVADRDMGMSFGRVSAQRHQPFPHKRGKKRLDNGSPLIANDRRSQ